MNIPFIIDAHVHSGASWMYYAPSSDHRHMLKMMDKLSISHVVCSDMADIFYGSRFGLEGAARVFEETNGRVRYLGVFDPGAPRECVSTLKKALAMPGFLGLKIHPSLHKTPPESGAYELAWKFAADHDLTLLTHSWSVSDYNPIQAYSTPERFERYAGKYPGVRFVLGHAGGRGTGRSQAIRMANDYPNVYLDFAGDIFCFRYLETISASLPDNKLIFGSDYPMLDPRANLSRVLLADIDDRLRKKLLRDNAAAAYKMEDI